MRHVDWTKGELSFAEAKPLQQHLCLQWEAEGRAAFGEDVTVKARI